MGVAIHALSKVIKGRTILDNISIEAPSGCITGLSGVNGSGKSMLMRAVAGLIRPTSGIITIDGRVLWNEIEFPPSIGLLIENPAFLSGRTGIDNLRLLASIKGVADESRIRKTLGYVGLDPDDKRRFSKYSLGMKQRLGLAAAVMEHPRILLLDEPTNALDSAGVEMLKKLVRGYRDHGAAVILSCHDASILDELSDRIYYLAEGHLDGCKTLNKALSKD